ncbi:hypothetical protein FQN54_000313 [Arachnomyces sp. PD_36]|nr:hypothetical protein FQN54_000313 [Arachnomyces sp. PD_36]
MSNPMIESFLSLGSSLSSIQSDRDAYVDEQVAKRKLSDYTPTTIRDDTAKLLTPRLVKAYGNATPVTPSPLDDADFRVEEVVSMLIDPSSRNDQAKLKRICLQRDGYRCLISGAIDRGSRGKFPDTTNMPHASTQLAHILPFSLGEYESSNSAEELDVARKWESLYTCFPAIRDRLSPDDVNDPTNLMTLMAPLHHCFGDFQFALEPTEDRNTYEIKLYDFETSYTHFLPPPNEQGIRTVKFKKHFDCQLPSPILLETHAAIAKILHATGRGEAIDEILQKRVETRCLAPDGSSAELLSALLVL